MAIPPEISKWFGEIEGAVRRHPELCSQINGIFHFLIRGTPTISFTADLKNSPGSVVATAPPAGRTADCTIEYKSAADFIAINNGKQDLKMSILRGKLKVRHQLFAGCCL